jgi:hypothetical protein
MRIIKIGSKRLKKKSSAGVWKECYEKIITFYPAWDRRNSDPGKDYGIHGVGLRIVLVGKRGAIELIVFTNWMLPHVQQDLNKNFFDHLSCGPYPVDVLIHSKKPTDLNEAPRSKCVYLGKDKCYANSKHQYTKEVWDTLLYKGSEGVWEHLLKIYKEEFSNV